MDVISIDFDIIMSPSINFYNDMVGDDVLLSQLLEDFPQLENSFNADLYIYQYFTRLITEMCCKGVPVYFITNHQDILPYLQQFEEPVNVYNFDHHHDIGYGIKNWVLKISKPACGNWVKYGKDNNLINDYIWIHDNAAGDLEDLPRKKYLTREYTLEEYGNTSHKLDVGAVVVCASWEWIPPIYKPLFNSWIAICEEVTGKEINIDNFEKK